MSPSAPLIRQELDIFCWAQYMGLARSGGSENVRSVCHQPGLSAVLGLVLPEINSRQ